MSDLAIEALQRKVGVTNSQVITSHDYKISRIESGGLAFPKLLLLNTAKLKLTDSQGGAEYYGWKDLLGDVTPKTSGGGSPQLATFRDGVRWFNYAAGDDGDMVFHIPHDYVPGTDLYLHPHWAHNGTNISGSIDIRLHLTYSKGHQQAAFHDDVEPHIVVSSLNLTNTPQYWHRIDEIKISQSGGSATLLNTDNIEVDGLILVHYDFDVIPTITGGSGKPFLFAFDLHYQASTPVTKNKAPPFYG